MKKTDKQQVKIRRQKVPLGTLRNPWFEVTAGGTTRYYRVTKYGMWMLPKHKLPKGVVVRKN